MDAADACAALCNHVMEGELAKVQAYIAAGLNVNCADYALRTPLHIAESEGNAEAAALLVAHGANVDARDRWGDSPATTPRKGAAPRPAFPRAATPQTP